MMIGDRPFMPPRRAFLHGLAAAALVSAVPAFGDEPPQRADHILVLKSTRRLYLLRGDDTIATYPIALGAKPSGPKRRRGDGKTPEGNYLIDGRNPHTPYYRALHISYPSRRDIARALASHADPGGNICVHGLPEGYEDLDPAEFTEDWTRGCIAVSNRAMDEIWDRVANGTPISIRS